MQLRWNAIVAALVVLGASMWLILFFVSQTPKELVGNSLRSLVFSKGAVFHGSVYWEDASPGGQGYVFGGRIAWNGTIDAHEPGVARIQGASSFEPTTNADDLERADIAADQSHIAFLPFRVNESHVAYLRPSEESTTGTWVMYDRNELLRYAGLSWMIASGTTESITTALETSDPFAWFRVLSSTKRVVAGREILFAKIAPNPEAVAHAIFLTMSAWQGKNLTTTELASAERIAHGMQLGEWTMEVDAWASRVRSVQARWLILDTRGNIARRVTLDITFDHLGYSGSPIVVDPVSVDITDRIRPRTSSGFASPGERPTSTPVLPSATSTAATSTEETLPNP